MNVLADLTRGVSALVVGLLMVCDWEATLRPLGAVIVLASVPRWCHVGMGERV